MTAIDRWGTQRAASRSQLSFSEAVVAALASAGAVAVVTAVIAAVKPHIPVLSLGVLYVFATCGALLVASSRLLMVFGLINLGMVITLSWLTFTGLTSLWCAWAAITSFVIAIYLRRSLPRAKRTDEFPILAPSNV